MTIEIINHTNAQTRIENFSKSRYVDNTYMELEWQKVWKETWLLAGLESDVQQPGCFFVFDLGREQILLTRTNQNIIQGFYNVCQHLSLIHI